MKLDYDRIRCGLKNALPESDLTVAGRETEFIQRARVVAAFSFVWAVVLSRFGQGTPGFEQARNWFSQLTGDGIWRRAFQIRFKSEKAVRLMAEAFKLVTRRWRARARRAAHPLGKHFSDVVAWDSSHVEVKKSLSNVYPTNGRGGFAALKVFLGISVFGNVPLFARVTAGNVNDHSQPPPLDSMRKGTLLLFDKGFTNFSLLRRAQEAGLYFLCPMRTNGTAVIVAVNRAPKRVRQALARSPEGVPLRQVLASPPATKESQKRRPKAPQPSAKTGRIRSVWDLEVLVTPKGRGEDRTPVRMRLVILPGPHGEQRRYLTNLDTGWTPHMLRELYRMRWQVELVFKELKQDLNLTSLPTGDPHAVAVLVWGSLLALAVSRTLSTSLASLKAFVGLANVLRPQIATRSLRSAIDSLSSAVAKPRAVAVHALRSLIDCIFSQANQLQREREDSFARLAIMLG